MEILAIIPARGGSKGVPQKNIKPVGGRPLLSYTIEHALASQFVTRTVVSTDALDIARVAESSGAEIVWRPAALSGDEASSESALVHVLETLQNQESYQPDLIVFLQCTSPIRQPDDIDRAVQMLLDEQSDSLLSVIPFHTFIWQKQGEKAIALDYDFRCRPRRQERAPEFIENGSFYVFRPWVLKELGNRLGGRISLFPMHEWSIVDINGEADLALCEAILSRWPGHMEPAKTRRAA